MPLYRILPHPDGVEAGTSGGVGCGGEPADRPDPRPPADPEASAAIRAEFEARLRAREADFARELEERDRKAAEWERACRAAIRDRELATALAGKGLVAGAAAQLIKLWRDELDTFERGGGVEVAARDGRPVAQAVADWLASPEYAHFCQPTSRGGTALPGAQRPAAADPRAPAPRNLGEAAILRWRQEAAARATEGTAPIGLGRRRV